MDKRVRRTQKLLRDTLVELMLEKQLQQITVTDIVRRADISRGTFYLHYRDVYDLLAKIEDDTLRGVAELAEKYFVSRAAGRESLIGFGNQLFDHIIANQRLCRALFLSDYSTRFIVRFQGVLVESILAAGLADSDFRLPQGLEPEDRIELCRYLALFIAGGISSILIKWLQSGDGYSQEKMQRITNDIISETLSGRLP